MKDIVEELQEWAASFNTSPMDTMILTSHGQRLIVQAASKIEELRQHIARLSSLKETDQE